MKASMRIVSLVLAILLFLGISAVSVNAASVQLKEGIAFIDAYALRLRSEPSNTSTTLDYGHQNEVAVILGKTGKWYKVSYNLQTGYMHSDYLRVTALENAELGYGRVTGSKVNVRSGPNTASSILAQASAGNNAYILGINNRWFKVIYGSHIGYIRSDYLDLTEIPYENQDSTKKPLFFVGGKSTGVIPSASALKGTAGQDIVNTAKRYIGVPYLWGGSTPGGFDCSGFVQYVFNLHNISLPRTSKQQWTVGTAISKTSLQPGDLVFFANTYTTGISHLGIYVGDGQFIHSSSSKGVIISSLSNSYWASHYYGAKRVL